MKRTRETLTLLLLAGILCACGTEAPKEENKTAMYTEQSDANGHLNSNGVFSNEPEGPQYQQPTIDVLKGKPQLFPARYPVKRYPGSKVALVDVRPNRPPGYKNHVMLKTADRTPKISGYYRQQLMAEDWKKVKEYQNELYESTIWVKGDLECEVRISPDLVASSPDKKNVQLLYGLREKRRAAASLR